MKAKLVMDMPENCTQCPLEMDVEDTQGNHWEGNICRACGLRNEDMNKKPDWCPLEQIQEVEELVTHCGILNDVCPYEFGCDVCRLYSDYEAAKEMAKRLPGMRERR